ncbi:hypothetical protein [Halococcus saccharolyticus]|uniref:Uncharacterized protein n=1 Tax=Halococcus saccharolyticus DSM 5350 TaxID=1227455 RepID=M0MEE9_9EURY|nr:hypothetical protein [Halococcus saccharolyticus]EMA44106.1 hypothetical protein C449_11288 [Halococcus saccharolyticus DSM 5350]
MSLSHNRGRDGGSRLGFIGRGAGLLAALVGLLGAGYLLVISVIPYLFVDGATLAAENAPVMLFWSAVVIALSLGVGYWAWTEQVWRVWGLAVAVSVFSVLSLFSIGSVIVPLAVLSVIAAVLLTVERRTAVR